MAIVVDASVAIKWVVEEPGSSAAHALVLSERLLAPDFLLLECSNVLLTLVRRQKISRDNAVTAFAAIQAVPMRLIPLTNYVAAAQSIALDLDQTVYDCLYLAVAMAERAVLVTADESLCRAALAHPVYGSFARLL